MRIAIPIVEGKLSQHFGHCEAFALVDVDGDPGAIVESQTVDAPPHEPGLLPRWLAEKGTQTIIAGGMGTRAHDLFAEQGITVVVGAPRETPNYIVESYLAGLLETGDNACDH
jgi:predicted Fe-Mo cluster-binding NifX family protein